MTSHRKLFMIMLGATPPGRHIEQHDIFFGIGTSLNDLAADMKAFWPEPERIHIDAWREVTVVENYRIAIVPKDAPVNPAAINKKLFFINLGGYQENKFEEQHYVLLTVKDDRAAAFREAKDTFFYKHNSFGKGGSSHIDDKYGVDVDDLYEIDDVLAPALKEKYRVEIYPSNHEPEDELHLGYVKMSSLEKAL
ncbi:MAG TPA: DUF1543 domain-containing protein [Cyclobacteriaceae bacterium]|nr:DUF1543 domain-containing protein [Cyclobacteriaceae bacterium]